MLSEAHERAIDAVLATSGWEIGHVRHVRRLALALFLASRQLHGLDDPDADLLEAAALLHDVGYPTDPPNHHKVSARIIRTFLGSPFTSEQVELIALLARYHRKGCPKLSQGRYNRLTDRDRRRVTWLGGILRVADGLDRDHVSAVKWLTASVVHDRLEIQVAGAPPTLAAESADATAPSLAVLASAVEGAQRKQDLLERAVGLPVAISPRETRIVRPISQHS
jgi:exopolyphosphatase/pppGpp-phosphohydrolase